MSAKDSIATQTCELPKEKFNDFLTLYPIPFEFRVILPQSNQTVFDASPGFIYLGLTLLVVPSSPLLFSCARLMVVSPLSTSSEGSSICVELRLGLYPTSVRVFPDPILFLAGLKPSWEYGQQQHAIMAGGKGIYLSCFFLYFHFSLIYDLLFLLVKMAFGNFIYTEDDKELSFLPKEPSTGFGTGSLYVSVNTKPLKADEELVIQPSDVMADSRESSNPELFVVHLGSVAARIKDRKGS
ncbi:hypothetical protein Tco_0970443 [Tanacetum coccineum]